jgi:glycosyltransferase involved in cell wall biosynthesis
MNREELVSVIVPFFNPGSFLEEAIQSVFDQSYRSWELLLIDDGSYDLSSHIARRYAAQYTDKIRYLEHEGHQNRGQSASRNLGIRHSAGEYIAFLDADDVWLAHKLEEQVSILSAKVEAGMVYSASQYWSSWTGNSEDLERDYIAKLGVPADKLVKPLTLLTLSLEATAPTPCPSNILVRRRIVENIGGFEEAFRRKYLKFEMYEDQAFLAKVYLNTPVFVASGYWDKYRQHPNSCVSVMMRAGEKYRAGLVYLKWLSSYLTSRGVKDVELWQALRKKRARYRKEMLLQWRVRARENIRKSWETLQLRVGR